MQYGYNGQRSRARAPVETPQQKADRMQWWTDARFGMFIHLGLYSLPARHEWVKNYERLTNEQYKKYFESLTLICIIRVSGLKLPRQLE